MKQNRHTDQSHSFPPWHPTPITLVRTYLAPHLFCQLLHYSFPLLLHHFSSLTTPTYISANVFLFCPLSDLAWFYILLPPSYAADWKEKKRKEKSQTSNLYLAKHLHGSMTPWNSPSLSTALKKRARKGQIRKGMKTTGLQWKKLIEHWSVSFQTQEVKSLIISEFRFSYSQDFFTSSQSGMLCLKKTAKWIILPTLLVSSQRQLRFYKVLWQWD